MDSTKKDKKSQTFDVSAMNQLMFSLGRLKFSLRALEETNCTNALLSNEEYESTSESDCVPSVESNRILENVINEIMMNSNSENQKEEPDKSNAQKTNDPSNIEKLEIIHDKLYSEFKKIQNHHQSILSEKLKKCKYLSTHC